MSKQPLAVNYRMGEETFGSVFDTVKSTTRAASELAKLALSEFGFIYITHKDSWEILRVEGRYSRAEEVPTPTIIPVASVDSEELLTEAGDVITDESDDPILVDAAEIPTFDNSQADLSAPYGKIMANRVKLVAYPRIVDAAATTILFSLNNPIYLAPGATFPFTGRYRHPSGTYTNVAGIDMTTPMTTPGEYQMFANADGSGADLSADLTVTPTYGTADVVFSLHNGGASGGYVTKCDAVGRGVYTPDPVDFTAEDAVSIAAVGPYTLTIDMKYQDDPSILEGLANVILAQVKDPRVIPETIKFYPNRSGRLMNSFLRLEPGDRIPVIEDVSATNAEYFINGVEAKIKRGGIIQCTYYLRNAAYDTYESGEWDVDDWDADAATWAL